MNEEYKLEYWIDKTNYSKDNLESKLSQDFDKLEVEIVVKEETDYYLIIIEADKHNIDACHDHLNFEREEFFRANDELGDELRSKTYPILAEIETRLRRFITRSMSEVLGFNWWDRSTPKKIRKNVSRIEKQTGSKQAQYHHQIEFTMFDDLIELVTGKYQKWADTKNMTAADLAELLDDCETIEELKQKLSQKRKQTSLWEDVFSNYFYDKKAWKNLENKIVGIVIPIRNKVMHHRLIRIHEVRQLKKHRDKLVQIIGTAKSELPKTDLNKVLKSLRTLVENARFQFNQNTLSQLAIDPKVIEAFKKSAQLDPEIIKAITQTPLIDPEIMRRFTSGIKFRLQDFDNESGSDEDNKEDQNGDDKSDQDEDHKSNNNGENDKEDDSSEDDMNSENDKS